LAKIASISVSPFDFSNFLGQARLVKTMVNSLGSLTGMHCHCQGLTGMRIY